MRYCHRLGLVHRDLKPDNILYKSYEPSSSIKISDFGVAKFLLNNQKLYSSVGTPKYVAPEVFKSNGYTEKCDIWSLGVILYAMLSKEFPFDIKEGQPIEVLKEIILAGHINFSNKWKSINKKAKNLVKRLLEYDPNLRPSAEMILDDEWLNS